MSQSSPPDTSAIAAAAGTAGAKAGEAKPAARIAALEERIASLEPLLEQLQANSALGTKLLEYVGDLRDEQVFFNKARKWVAFMGAVTIVGLGGLLALAIFNERSPLLTATPAAIATVVIGLTSSIAFLLGAFVKGVFRSTAERHADGFLPPALETGLEILNKVSGKG